MSAGSKIVHLREVLRALVRYADHRRDCLAAVGGSCRCGFAGVMQQAQFLSGADPARTGGYGDRCSPRSARKW